MVVKNKKIDESFSQFICQSCKTENSATTSNLKTLIGYKNKKTGNGWQMTAFVRPSI